MTLNTTDNPTNDFAPPVQPAIHLTLSDEQFVIAVSLKNPTDEPITLQTMTTKLFSVSLRAKDNGEIWRPDTGAGQAVTNWTLDANNRVTSHFTAPNPETARERATQFLDSHAGNLYDDADTVEIVTGTERPDPDNYDSEVIFEQSVTPSEQGIISVEAVLPSPSNHHTTITRQFDLRTNPHRVLDHTIPAETRDAISNQF